MTAAPNFAYSLLAKRLRRHAKPGRFDLSTLRWALSGAEQVEPGDVEDLCEAGAAFGLRPEAILPAYGMAETTVAVSFSECGGGLVVDEVDADLLAVLASGGAGHQGQYPPVGVVGPAAGWSGSQGRALLVLGGIDEDGNLLPARGVGVIELRGAPVTGGYVTMGGFALV
jgi:fatty-acyl-CoA synthase